MKKSIGALLVLLLMTTVFISACSKKSEPETTYYTVKFSANGVSNATGIPGDKTVEEDNKIAAFADPKAAGHEFLGWYKDAGGVVKWEFTADKVTSDITLYAKWQLITYSPQNVRKLPFENQLQWQMRDVNSNTVFTLKFNETIVEGTHTISGSTVTWVPSIKVAEDNYKVTIKSERPGVTIDDVTVDIKILEIIGDGSVSNPYEVSDSDRFYELTHFQGNVGKDKYFLLTSDFKTTYLTSGDKIGTVDPSADDFSIDCNIGGSTFLGTLDGNNKMITVNGTDALFYRIGQTGIVKNFNIASAITVTESDGRYTAESTNTVGTVAHINEGLIDNVFNRSSLSRMTDAGNDFGTVGNISEVMEKGGVGGLVRINEVTGVIRSSGSTSTDIGLRSKLISTPTIKATLGGGGVAGINIGQIEDCTNAMIMGAGSLAATNHPYSYMGGIAGVNYGTILRVRNSSHVQSFGSSGNSAQSIGFGSIVGLNSGEEALVSEAVGASIRVQGATAVGGVAGINSMGTIEYSCTESTRMTTILGNNDIGGIVGQSNGGTVKYCYNTVEPTRHAQSTFTDTIFAIAKDANNSAYVTGKGTAPSGAGNYEGTLTGTTFADYKTFAATLNNEQEKFTHTGKLVWQATAITVNYAALGLGIGAEATFPGAYSSYSTNKLIPPAVNPTATGGYVFYYWANSDGSPFDFDNTVMNDSDFTLYAMFRPDTAAVTVKFVKNIAVDVVGMPDNINTYEQQLIPSQDEPTLEGYVFGGWFTTADCNAANRWDFSLDTIPLNVSGNEFMLYAKWVVQTDAAYDITPLAAGINVYNNSFSFKNIKSVDVSAFTVIIDDVEIAGTVEYTDLATKTAVWTPTAASVVNIQRGIRRVVVKSGGSIADSVETDIYFYGGSDGYSEESAIEITKDNLANITSGSNDDIIGTGMFFKISANITSVNNNTSKATFNGTLNGNMFELSSFNKILFYKIGTKGTVKNLLILTGSGTPVAVSKIFGSIAVYNYGVIDGCTFGKANVVHAIQQTATPSGVLITDIDDAAFMTLGGIAGVNFGTISNCINNARLYSGTAIGGIAGYNAKDANIITCTNNARIGVSAVTSDKGGSLNYSGGITGLNFGNITGSIAQASGSNSGIIGGFATNDTSVSIGGIAGYNGITGTISNCDINGASISGKTAVGGIVGIYVQAEDESGEMINRIDTTVETGCVISADTLFFVGATDAQLEGDQTARYVGAILPFSAS